MQRDRPPSSIFYAASTPAFRTEVAKFIVVGGANFVLTGVIFFVLLKLLNVNYLIGLTASWAAGLVFSYAMNFSWVFRPEEKLRFKARFGKFFLASLASLALNLVTLDFLVRRYGFDAFYVQFALIPLIVVFNFATAKFWSLRAVR
jgi:putative flippase GtrA